MAAMSRIPDVGEEVEVLGTALEKGLLDLAWDDYIPDPKHLQWRDIELGWRKAI
jgi:hypothetical protein